MILRLGALLFVLKALMVSADAAEKRVEAARPNVIFIFADDLGPGMLGCYGQQIVKTPHIDRLATEGIKFSNYYGNVFCAPARWALLSGVHDGRQGGWEHNRAGLLIRRDSGEITEEEYQAAFAQLKRDAYSIGDDEVFLAQVAQRAGYRTAQFGKLDRGFNTWAERVDRFGWDFHEGYYDHVRAHGFYPPYIWRNGERIDLPGNEDPRCGKTSEKGDEPIGAQGMTYSQNVFIEGILKFIREHKDEPFFLYHPTQLPHGPVAVPELHPDFADDPKLSFAEKKYASMVKMLDDHVGLILAELKTQGIDDNTIVFFTSDNGHELYYGSLKSNYRKQILKNGESANYEDKKWRATEEGDIFDGAGLRAGLKRSGYQGGIQCPMIVRWPGKIAPGSETDVLSAHYDFMATLADLVDGKAPDGKDGISYVPTLLSKPQMETHDYVFVNNHNRFMGSSSLITRDGWKLIDVGKASEEYQLYNLREDNEERFNLASSNPERVERLKAIFESEINSARSDL